MINNDEEETKIHVATSNMELEQCGVLITALCMQH